MVSTRNVRETHSKYLRDPEFAAKYLNEALEEGNPAVIRMALVNIAEAQRGDWGGADIRPEPKHRVEDMLPKTNNFTLADLCEAIQALGLHLMLKTRTKTDAYSEENEQAEAC